MPAAVEVRTSVKRPPPRSRSCTCSAAGGGGRSANRGSADAGPSGPWCPRGCGCGRRRGHRGRGIGRRSAPRGPVAGPVSWTTPKRQAAEVGAGDLGEPGAQLGSVVVAVDTDQPGRAVLQEVEGRRVDPVARRAATTSARGSSASSPLGQGLGALGEVGVGDQQEPHGSSLGPPLPRRRPPRGSRCVGAGVPRRTSVRGERCGRFPHGRRGRALGCRNVREAVVRLLAPVRRPRPSPVVFEADFSSAGQWVAGYSWAYPDGGPVNPGDDKLDHLVSDPAFSRDGVFRAARRDDGLWDTGLLTTEGSYEGFTVRTGDVLEVSARLPEGLGAWPAVWTWRDGGNEVDVFEYHPDNPGVLELSNHVEALRTSIETLRSGPAPKSWCGSSSAPRSVVWSVETGCGSSPTGGASDAGLGSVSDGEPVRVRRPLPPAPDPATTSLSFEVGRLRVYRP